MRKEGKGKDGQKRAGKRLRKEISDAVGAAAEVIRDLPLITLTGREEALIENFRGVSEYGDERIRISTPAGVVKITGRGLCLAHITSEDVVVSGTICTLEFME